MGHDLERIRDERLFQWAHRALGFDMGGNTYFLFVFCCAHICAGLDNQFTKVRTQ